MADSTVADSQVESQIKIKGFGEEEVKKIAPVVQDFVLSYAEKPDEVSDSQWLQDKLSQKLQDKTQEEISKISQELLDGVADFDDNLKSLNNACSEGKTKEEWLADKFQNVLANKGMSEYGDKLAEIYRIVDGSNQAMMNALEKERGTIDITPNAEPFINTDGWNRYNTRELAIDIGKQAALSGIGNAAMSTGIQLAEKVANGESISTSEVVKTAFVTGRDTGLKVAATGALKVGVEKGLIPAFAVDTSNKLLATTASSGIENARTLLKVATGNISTVQALEQLSRTSVVSVAGLSLVKTGATLGASIGSVVPVVGSTIGAAIGGVVGYVAETKIGNAITTGVKKIKSVAVSVAKSTWNTVKSTVKSVGRAIASVGRSIASFFGF